MLRLSKADRSKNRGGFTAVELLVTMVLGVIVLTAVIQVLISQSRLSRVQREAMDARESLRAAGSLLSWELMGAAATSGDLYSISSDSVSLRSVGATGVVCAIKQSGPATTKRYGLQLTSGSFLDAVGDSALVVSGSGWAALPITKTWGGTAWDPAPAGGGTPFCFWADTATVRPQVTVELTGDSTTLANIRTGAPMRAFEEAHYGLFQQDGRWWLGRRIGAGAYDILTGPMQAPTDSGLVFTYYDATGTLTTDSSLVAEVDIVLRSQSYGPAPTNKSLTDSVTMKVALRNNAK